MVTSTRRARSVRKAYLTPRRCSQNTKRFCPAPESSHAIRTAIDVALECKERGEAKTILFGLTGNGYFDLAAYENYNNGKMQDYAPSDEDIEKGLSGLPHIPGIQE